MIRSIHKQGRLNILSHDKKATTKNQPIWINQIQQALFKQEQFNKIRPKQSNQNVNPWSKDNARFTNS